ncbi:restriction endonuclease subunit S [Methylobacterium brachiatum]
MNSTIPLGDLITIRGGGTPSRSIPAYWNGEIYWATVKDFKSMELAETEESITLEGIRESATNVIPAGSVIVPTRMAVGKAAINTIDLAINQDLKALLPGSDVESRFLLHFMLAQGKYLESQAQGATVKGIKLDLLRSLPFPRIPRSEQRRIAAILDKADAIRRKRAEAIALADDFLRSAYLSLVGLKHPNYYEWEPAAIESLAEEKRGSIRSGPFGSALLHSEFVDEGIAVLGIDNAVKNKFQWAERRYITHEKYEELRRYRIFPKDVIITIMGTTGRSAVVPDDIPEAITTKHLASITCDLKKIIPEVLSFAIHSDPVVIEQIRAANKGAIMDGLNLGIIRQIKIRTPPMRQQRMFADLLRKTHSFIQRATTPDGDGSELFASLSQRAFRGEL